MKKAIIWIAVLGIAYCFAAFIALDFNFAHWEMFKTSDGRVFMVLCLICSSVLALFITNATDNSN